MSALRNAGEILQVVVEDGRRELGRASAGLLLSGFGAGLNISFGAVAMAEVGAKTGGIGLLAMAVYPLGFVVVILGRAQLFTENTVTPVTVALVEPREIPNMLRLWALILLGNLLGAFVFAAAIVFGDLLTGKAMALLVKDASSKLEYGFWLITLKGIFGGWIVALMAWLVAAAQDTVSRILLIWGLAFLIPLLSLTHSVAGASEVLMSVYNGANSWSAYAFLFQLPTTIGNILGGVILVALLNYGQVIGSSRDLTPWPRRDRRSQDPSG